MKRFLTVVFICFCIIDFLNAAALETTPKNEIDSLSEEEKKLILASIGEECTQKREIGRCFASFYRFFFNVETLNCEEFIYGGCMGNRNNFETLAECEHKCLKKESSTERLSEESIVTDTNEEVLNDSITK